MFIILDGAEAGLSRSSTSRAGSWVSLSFSIQGRGRSLALREGQTSTTRGWSTAGVVSFSALGSPAWLPVPPHATRAVVAPHAREDRPRRRALLGRRSCSGVSCLCSGTVPPRGGRCFARPGGSEWGSAGGLTAPVVGVEVQAAQEVLVADGITATIRAPGLQLFVLVLAPRASVWARARLQRRPP
jgi:hypothetical protein